MLTKKQIRIRVSLTAIALAVLAYSAFVGAGTGPVSNAVPGTTILASDFNKITGALKQDLVPRNTSGIATNIGGSLGTSSFKWLRAQIESGYWSAGDMKIHHTYGGDAPIGQGWMKADGRIINEANYDAEHGAGSWDIYVVSSPIDGRYLPNMANRYPYGGGSIGDGVTPIATTGLALNQFDNRHRHSTPNHRHMWFLSGNMLANDQSFNVSGSTPIAVAPTSFTGITAKASGSGNSIGATTGGGNLYTDLSGADFTDFQGSNVQSIQPASVSVDYYVRVF